MSGPAKLSTKLWHRFQRDGPDSLPINTLQVREYIGPDTIPSDLQSFKFQTSGTIIEWIGRTNRIYCTGEQRYIYARCGAGNRWWIAGVRGGAEVSQGNGKSTKRRLKQTENWAGSTKDKCGCDAKGEQNEAEVVRDTRVIHQNFHCP